MHICLRVVANACSQLLNEIMPMIYKRFTEKSSEEWRQIYKVSQLPPTSKPR
jgi:epsin